MLAGGTERACWLLDPGRVWTPFGASAACAASTAPRLFGVAIREWALVWAPLLAGFRDALCLGETARAGGGGGAHA